MNIRVLSYNIHKGWGGFRREFLLERIRQAIRSLSAEIVFLQEVTGENSLHRETVPDWPEEPQFEYLADQVWSHYAYGKNAVYPEGHHGNAILSKFPFVWWRNIDISTNRFERRGMLHAVIELPQTIEESATGQPAKEVHIASLHLDLLERGRRQQVRTICDYLMTEVPRETALIVAGDFNDWRQRITPVLAERTGLSEVFMTWQGEHARTFPSFMPSLTLDRIYARGFEVKAASRLAGPFWRDLSDHVALFTELEDGRQGSPAAVMSMNPRD